MSDVDEIKSRLNIVDIIGKHVALKKTGRNLKGLCPFHNEKTPSFIVSPDRQRFHCFGCGKGGDIFSFITEYHHVDFTEALEDLADLSGVKLTRRVSDTKEGNLKQKLYEVNHLASEFYHYMLTTHTLGKKALHYLASRGISEKSIDTFTLGYSPNSWDGLYKFLRKKGYDDELMEKAGLIIKSQNSITRTQRFYDRFRGRLMFTLKDHRGNVVGFAGRVLDSGKGLSAGRQEAKYINTSETPVYSKSNVLYGLDVAKDAIQKANEAVIMEGELDVISSFQAGIPNAIAIKGSALTEGHVLLLKRFTERIVFALDSDLAGDAASRRGIEIADSAGLDMRVVTLPSGKDPDEAAREHPGLLKKAIKDAVPVYDYFLASAIARFDKSTAYGKKKISEELLPAIAKIENPIVQHHYMKKVADTIGVSEDAITEGMRKIERTPIGKKKGTEVPQNSIVSRPDKLEIYILALLLQGNTVQLFEELQEEGLLTEFSQPAVHKILDELITHLSARENEQAARVFLIKDFADALSPELVSTLDEAFLWDIADIVENDELYAREWLRAIHEFKRVILRRTLFKLTQQVSNESIKPEESQAIQQKLRTLSAALRNLEKSG